MLYLHLYFKNICYFIQGLNSRSCILLAFPVYKVLTVFWLDRNCIWIKEILQHDCIWPLFPKQNMLNMLKWCYTVSNQQNERGVMWDPSFAPQNIVDWYINTSSIVISPWKVQKFCVCFVFFLILILYLLITKKLDESLLW